QQAPQPRRGISARPLRIVQRVTAVSIKHIIKQGSAFLPESPEDSGPSRLLSPLVLKSPGTPGAFFYSRRQLLANAAIAASRVASSGAAGRSYSFCLYEQSVTGVTESLAGIAVEARARIIWSKRTRRADRHHANHTI